MTSRSAILGASGCLALVGVWALVAARQLTVLVPSPVETVERLIELGRGPLWTELALTGWRALQGTVVAICAGTMIGLLTGSSPSIAAFLRPVRAVLTGIPPIITVVLVSIWIGIDGEVAPFVVAAATMPIIWMTTAEAVRSIDPRLLEMAAGLHLGRMWVLRRLTVPAIVAPVRAVAAYTAATALRLTIMAELLSSATGIGARIARARTTLDTPEVFAWALVAIAAAVALEALTLRYQIKAPTRPS